ncbi:MAG TPA: family 16 glycosylhydrolase [Cytophagaceae bacterium]
MKNFSGHSKYLWGILLFLFPGITTFAQSTLYQSPCSELIWQDEFDGTELDSDKWSPQIGDGCPSLCGWGNDEAQYYTDRPENIKVENGKLIITSLKEEYEGKSYTSARLRTIHKGDFTFGRIEARIKLPEGVGSWAAFWLLPTDDVYGTWAASGEIDIMEYQGKNPGEVSGTIHYGGAWPDNKYKGAVHHLPTGQYYHSDFHVYAIEWDSTEIRWYMDDKHYATRTKEEIAPLHWPFDQRFHIILNNAIGGHLGGTINDSHFPMTMEVDYVRVYSSPLNRSIIGEKKALKNSIVSYYIPSDISDVSYTWTVPSGTAIISGQGTDSITVQWGDTDGDITLELERNCDIFTLSLPVKLYADDCHLIFNDYDNQINIDYKSSSGSFQSGYTNPFPTAGNSSAKIARYTRRTTPKDSIIFGNLIPQDYAEFETGERSFYMDIYTVGKPGTIIDLELRNQELYTMGTGTRSTFRAYTSKQNEWETLKFELLSVNDPDIKVDQYVFFIDPDYINNENTSQRRYHIDNFRRGKVASVDITGNDSPDCQKQNETYSVTPNAGSSYSWSVPNGATIVSGQNTSSITVDWGTTSGYITLTETNSDGCEDIAAQLMVSLVGCPTAVKHTSESLGIKLYPNPFHNKLILESKLKNLDIRIINNLGENVLNESLNETYKEIDLSTYPDGIYFIQLRSGDIVVYEKIIKGN